MSIGSKNLAICFPPSSPVCFCLLQPSSSSSPLECRHRVILQQSSPLLAQSSTLDDRDQLKKVPSPRNAASLRLSMGQSSPSSLTTRSGSPIPRMSLMPLCRRSTTLYTLPGSRSRVCLFEHCGERGDRRCSTPLVHFIPQTIPRLPLPSSPLPSSLGRYTRYSQPRCPQRGPPTLRAEQPCPRLLPRLTSCHSGWARLAPGLYHHRHHHHHHCHHHHYRHHMMMAMTRK